MINKLKINNFKSIKKIELEFSKFNILCGENASGKTAIIHSILAAIQRYEDFSIGLDGEIIKIGNYLEIHNRNVSGNVEIEIEDYKKRNKKVIINKENNLIIETTEKRKLDIVFEKDIFYLSSNRIGVMDTYIKGNTKFGVNGLSFVDFISRKKEDTMPKKYINIFEKFKRIENIKEETINNLKEHVRFWFKFLTKENLDLDAIPYTNQYILTFGKNTRSINTGSGFSYLLPIIAVCLGALIVNKDGDNMPIIIIENPEIYLHPKAQDELTKFLLFISNFTQIIIETHSDHILKTSIENKNIDDRIFVFKLNNEEETEKIEMNSTNFKTNPISYAEVQYKAFGIITPELHIILYSQLHEKCKKESKCGGDIKDFDEYLAQQTSVPKKYDTYKRRDYKTLPTYIRNYIDHPENTARSKYKDFELKQSVDFLLSQL